MAISTISQAGLNAPITLTSPTLTTPNINSAQFATVSGTAPIYPCRAWVNFNGVGTVTIRGSGNVSSITDGGISVYTVNFTTAMPDANYVYLGSGDAATATITTIYSIGNVPTASALAIRTYTSAGAGVDSGYVMIAIFR
jgi:hypothetical protein